MSTDLQGAFQKYAERLSGEMSEWEEHFTEIAAAAAKNVPGLWAALEQATRMVPSSVTINDSLGKPVHVRDTLTSFLAQEVYPVSWAEMLDPESEREVQTITADEVDDAAEVLGPAGNSDEETPAPDWDSAL